MIGLFILVLGYKLDIGVLKSRLELLQRQLTDKKDFMQKENQILSQGKNFGGDIDKVESLRRLEDFDILRVIEAAAVAAQIEISLFEPQVSAQAIKLKLIARYKNQLEFIGSLLKKDFLVKIEKFELEKGGSKDSDILSANLFLVFYKNSLGEQMSAKKLSINILERDIFKWPDNKNGLHVWLIRELRFAGTMKLGEKVFGVVTDPMGDSHKVAVGDKLGLDQSKVVEINQKGIITANQGEIK